tara:strand:- start:263 stop:631 length:369 start_codon:yes stop_codon:yes gene_type:complete
MDKRSRGMRGSSAKELQGAFQDLQNFLIKERPDVVASDFELERMRQKLKGADTLEKKETALEDAQIQRFREKMKRKDNVKKQRRRDLPKDFRRAVPPSFQGGGMAVKGTGAQVKKTKFKGVF